MATAQGDKVLSRLSIDSRAPTKQSLEATSENLSKTSEHKEMDRLCELVLRIGSLIHQLQKERGVSAICMGGGEPGMLHTLSMLQLQTDKSLLDLTQFPDFPSNMKVSPTTLGHVREEVRRNADTYLVAVKVYNKLISCLIKLISDTLRELRTHHVGQTVASYLAFMHLKESIGIERAIVGGLLSTNKEKCLPGVYADLVVNLGHQEAYTQAFTIIAPNFVLEEFNKEIFFSGELETIQNQLYDYKMAGRPNDLAAAMPDLDCFKWFDLMTARLDRLEKVERMIARSILANGTQELRFKSLKDGSRLVTSAELSAMGLSEDYQIDLRELDVQREIGRGTTGSTYLANWRGTKCAVKVVQVQKEAEEASLLMKDFTREIEVLLKARHPNICQFLGAAIDPPTYCLVLEYMENGSLYDILRSGKEISFFDIAMGVARGMEYLHYHCHMMHRDMKSPNLLLDESGKVKIADFGLTCLDNQGDKTAEIGTYRWMAPEVIRHEPYGLPADVYSYGMVLYELYTRKLPFEGMSPMKVAMAVATKDLRPELPADIPPLLGKLITDSWCGKSSRRPTFKEVLSTLNQIQEGLSAADKALLQSKKLFKGSK